MLSCKISKRLFKLAADTFQTLETIAYRRYNGITESESESEKLTGETPKMTIPYLDIRKIFPAEEMSNCFFFNVTCIT